MRGDVQRRPCTLPHTSPWGAGSLGAAQAICNRTAFASRGQKNVNGDNNPAFCDCSTCLLLSVSYLGEGKKEKKTQK